MSSAIDDFYDFHKDRHYRNVNDGDIQLCEVLGTALATDESLFYFFLFGLARIAIEK